MLDILSAVQAELSGPRAANYSSLSDSDAATALQNSGQIYQDVTVGTVEGYLRGKGIVTAFEDWLASPTPPTGMAKVAVRELLGLITGKVDDFELSDPVKFAEIKGMMDALAAESGSPFTAQNETDVLALGVPVIPVKTVIAARILNGVDYKPWSWSQGTPFTVGNAAAVTITLANALTGEKQERTISAPDLTKEKVRNFAAMALVTPIMRDAAVAAMLAG